MTTTEITDITEADIRRILAERGDIALFWAADDVRLQRPDLSGEAAFAVLQACERAYDPRVGVTFATIERVANELFPSESD